MMILVSLLLQAAGPSAAAQMELVCGGAGAAKRVETESAYAANSNGQTAWGTVQRSGSEAFEDQVDVRIAGTESRIRLPRVMLPPIHGGDAGWFRMKDVVVSEDAITGTAVVNFMNSPKIHIDRRTGSIGIDGKAGHYSGKCEKVDASAAKRF